MSNIPYTYEVTHADEFGTMLVYRSPGRPDVPMGVHTPREGETLDVVAAMYAPIAHWLDLERPRLVPAVGTTGSFTPPTEEEPNNPFEQSKARKLAELADQRYAREVSGTLVDGVRISTDRASQAAVSNTLLNFSLGLIQSVDWKAADGRFVQFDQLGFELVAQAVTQHVQACRSTEALLAEAVAAATSEEELAGISFPDIVSAGV